MEVEIGVKASFRTRIREIPGLFRVHSDEDLHERIDPRVDPLTCVFLNLEACLAYRNIRVLQLNMNNRHAVDQEKQIPSSLTLDIRVNRELRLVYDLIAAFAGSDFLSVVNLERNLFPEMRLIVFVIAFDNDAAAIDEAIQLHRGPERFDLLQDLSHFAFSQRVVVKPVNLPVVLEKNVRPVFDQILF